MGKTIRARFSNGVIKPLEEVDVADGKEVFVTIVEAPISTKEDAFERSALFFFQFACLINIIKILCKNILESEEKGQKYTTIWTILPAHGVKKI